MSGDGGIRADTALSDEAIDWVVRLNSGSATASDRVAFAEWRGRSDAHEAAAAEAEAIWHGVGLAGEERQKATRRRHTRRAVLGTLLVGGAGLAAYGSGVMSPGFFADNRTGTGERRDVALDDGSVVRMNAETAFSTDFRSDRRHIVLHRGQAVFEVVHDPARPFVVEADGGRTRAIGTAFDVDIRTDAVVVTVIEGVVGVSGGGETEYDVTAAANQAVRYGGEGVDLPVAVDVDTATAWRRGKLIFDNRPLGEVVTELDRQLDGRIVIASSRLARLKVTGVFDLDRPQAVLDSIGRSLPVRITRLPYLTLLR